MIMINIIVFYKIMMLLTYSYSKVKHRRIEEFAKLKSPNSTVIIIAHVDVKRVRSRIAKEREILNDSLLST